MSESFFVAINAVIPFFFYLSLGGAARAAGVVDEPFLTRLTKVAFTVMFPFMTFYNIYSAGREHIPSVRLLVFIVCGIGLLIALLLWLVPRLVKENARRGVIIQAIFRSNFLLFGLPLTASVFGSEKAAVASMLAAVVPTIYNIAAVIILEMFNSDGRKTSPGALLRKAAKNPILQGCVAGLLFVFLHIRLPACLAEPVGAISAMTTPLAMFALGGTLRFRAIAKNLPYLAPALLAKLVLIPLALLPAAYALGLRGVELFMVITVFGTPSAAASYPMAASMGGDGELAGQFVFLSTALALLTMFLWIFVLGHMGLLAG